MSRNLGLNPKKCCACHGTCTGCQSVGLSRHLSNKVPRLPRNLYLGLPKCSSFQAAVPMVPGPMPFRARSDPVLTGVVTILVCALLHYVIAPFVMLRNFKDVMLCLFFLPLTYLLKFARKLQDGASASSSSSSVVFCFVFMCVVCLCQAACLLFSCHETTKLLVARLGLASAPQAGGKARRTRPLRPERCDQCMREGEAVAAGPAE